MSSGGGENETLREVILRLQRGLHRCDGWVVFWSIEGSSYVVYVMYKTDTQSMYI